MAAVTLTNTKDGDRSPRRGGRYFVTVMVEETPAPRPAAERTVVIDLGLKALAVLSTGEAIANPRHLQRKQRRLKRA